ncbi:MULTISPECIES: hypothetical protein [unclassified Flavobacterium]|uniref:hypothetical protein n=1 Tax=unclassified Flavobacterium TaxID=196869 RepID=UPI0018EEF159|nr:MULTISPECIES: hypothetical protein [unclassified Flavobacterium]
MGEIIYTSDICLKERIRIVYRITEINITELLNQNLNLTPFKISEEKLHLNFEEKAKPSKKFTTIALVTK